MVAVLGEVSLAAVTTGSINTFSFFILPMGTVFIVSSFSSQFFGQNDLAGARRYGWYGLGVAALTQILAVFSTIFIPSIISLFPYDKEVQLLMSSYMIIRLWSGGAAIGLEALANYYGGLGNTRLPMIANVGAMVLNVFANWVFIFGNLGVPAMGVSGAAWGSVISTAIAFLFLLLMFWFGVGETKANESENGFKVPQPISSASITSPVVPSVTSSEENLSFTEFYRMIRFGLPSGLNWFFEMMAFILFINVVVGGLGTTSLAAMMAVLSINHAAFMPAFGFMSAGAILAGQAIGAERKQDVYIVTRLTLSVILTWLTFISLVYLLLPFQLLNAFSEDSSVTNAEFLETGRNLLIMAAAWQAFDGTAGTFAEILRAAGDTTYPMVARLLVSWLIFVPATFISTWVFHAGAFVATFWVVFYIAILALILWRRFYKRTWETMDLTGHHH
jgi:MATE family multidrug resistance protein